MVIARNVLWFLMLINNRILKLNQACIGITSQSDTESRRMKLVEENHFILKPNSYKHNLFCINFIKSVLTLSRFCNNHLMKRKKKEIHDKYFV